MDLSLPEDIFSWTQVYGDDLGYEPRRNPAPTLSHPGSEEKLAVLRDRAARGESLFHSWDKSELPWRYDDRLSEVVSRGDKASGALIGRDQQGGRHRYAIWRSMKSYHPKRMRMLYVTATAGFCDNWNEDPELDAIQRHATLLNATHVTVCPLMTLRVKDKSEWDENKILSTEIGAYVLRAVAKQSEVAVLCFGYSPQLERWRDVIWILSKTIRRAQLHYAAREPSDSLWPPTINRLSPPALQRYPHRDAIDEAYYDQ